MVDNLEIEFEKKSSIVCLIIIHEENKKDYDSYVAFVILRC